MANPPSYQIKFSDRSRYSTALLIGEKCAVLVAEDLGYSGEALEMKVPTYNAPGELKIPFRL
jgi:alcohol oxidase